jgi:hypothetical protein
MMMFGKRPFRCRFCECRFYRSAAAAPEIHAAKTVAAPDLTAPKSDRGVLRKET